MNRSQKFHRDINRSMAILTAAGYQCSHSSVEPWDVIAVSSNDFIVLKVSDRLPPLPCERFKIDSFVCPPNTRRLVHHWPRRSKLPTVMEI